MKFEEVHLLIGTPMYGGMCHKGFVESLLLLQQLCFNLKIRITTKFISNESLITRGRNLINCIFLSDPAFTHLLFIDGDISYNPQSIIRMIEADLDIVCGAYPKKSIQWDKICELLQYKDIINKDNIDFMSADYVVNFKQNENKQIYIKNGFAEVLYGGTGFMLIKKDVMISLKNSFPHLKYTNDVGGYLVKEDMKDYFYTLFDCAICPKTNRYLSEDYLFCQRAIDHGFKIWMDLNCNLIHTGTHNFFGSFGQFLQNMELVNKKIKEKEYQDNVNLFISSHNKKVFKNSI
jgi:hypothetical protein